MARIAIIGTGWGSRAQAPAFRKAGLEVVAIAGHDPEKTRRIAKDLGVEPFESAEELVDGVEADLVSIVSPPPTHLPLALRALERGLHVLCEKPTALHADEADAMLRASERHPDRLALIDHELRFLPAWIEAKRRIGELGAIRYAEVRYASPSRSDPDRKWNWWSDAAQGGGVWGAVGSHYVDGVRWFAGEIDAVRASMRTFVRERPDGEGRARPVTSDDFAAVHLRLASGALAAMTFTVVAPVDEDTGLTLVGERGAFRLTGVSLFHASLKGEWKEVVPGERLDMAGDTPGGAFGTGTVHLGRALRAAVDEGKRDALVHAATFADGLRQQEVLDAARRSSEAGEAWTAVRR